jgi:hypothetical protein
MPFARSTPAGAARPLSFPRWRAVLAASKLSVDQRWRFATEIRRFLKYCQILNAPVNRPRAREYLTIVPLVSARPDARQALRWFFRTARVARHRRHTAPSEAAWCAGDNRGATEAFSVAWYVPPEEEAAVEPAADSDAAYDYP